MQLKAESMIQKVLMKMKDSTFLIVISLVGLIIGFSAYQLIPEPQNQNAYCENIEEGIRENRSIDGPIDCFPPAGFEQNNISEVENLTELECLCEYRLNGEDKILQIRRSQ